MKNFDTPPSSENLDEKEEKINEARNRVEKITDRLGKPIDDGIKESVIAFMVNEFPTSSSCEGHLSDEPHRKRFSFPQVRVYAPEPEGWRESEEKQRQWSEENAVYRKRIDKLLDEFYTGRDIDEEYKLIADPIGIFNAFTIISEKDKIGLSQEENEIDVLNKARQEISDFTNFLMDKFNNQ